MNIQMRAFFEKVQRDEELQAKLARSGSASRDDVFRTVVQVAAEAGYSFTEADLGSAVEAATGEMTPEQREQVPGMGMPPTSTLTGYGSLDWVILTSGIPPRSP